MCNHLQISIQFILGCWAWLKGNMLFSKTSVLTACKGPAKTILQSPVRETAKVFWCISPTFQTRLKLFSRISVLSSGSRFDDRQSHPEQYKTEKTSLYILKFLKTVNISNTFHLIEQDAYF